MPRKSLYARKYVKDLPKCRTVGELREALAKLPDALPLGPDNYVRPVWYNVGFDETGGNGEHLELVSEFWDDEE